MVRLTRAMERDIYFDDFVGSVWPEPDELSRYFLAPKGERWTFETGNDNWGLGLKGVDGTSHLPADKGNTNIFLYMTGHPEFGVHLNYQKLSSRNQAVYFSKGDPDRLKEWIRTLHGDLLPVGLFISYEAAWAAVKEFMETDGELPKSIEWVADEDLPEGTFPLQHEKVDGPVY